MMRSDNVPFVLVGRRCPKAGGGRLHVALLLLLLLLLRSGQHGAHAQQCSETCSSGDCVQSNFAACSVACDGDGTCLSAVFAEAATVTCTTGACKNAEFAGSSDVSCGGSGGWETCRGAAANQTRLACTDDACRSMHFYSSAVSCPTSYSVACGDSSGHACSCCDGRYCPENLPSCTADPLAFCSSQYLGRTCKEWGNPLCEPFDIAPSGNVEVTQCLGGDCVGSQFDSAAVFCDNLNNAQTFPSCQSASFVNSKVGCESGACKSASFEQSEVECLYDGSCEDATFTESTVDCEASGCMGANFVASAVSCPSSYNVACTQSTGDACTCCDGRYCPSGSESCTADPVAFCSKIVNGRSCAAQGNPLCSDFVGEDNPISAPVSPPTDPPVSTSAPVSPPVEPPVPVQAVTPAPVIAPVKPPTDQPVSTSAPVSPPVEPPVPVQAVTSAPVIPTLETSSPVGSPVADGGGGPLEEIRTTTADTPLKMAPRSEDVDSVRILTWPLNGSLAVNGDHSVTYTPNAGFSGLDSFVMESCTAGDQCQSISVTMEVVASVDTTTENSNIRPTGDSGDSSSSSGGLYGLAALAIIPIVALVVFRKRLGCGCQDNSKMNAPSSIPVPVSYASTQGPDSRDVSTSGATEHQPTPSYRVTNKDQARTVVAELREPGPQPVSQRNSVASRDTMKSSDQSLEHLPDQKDQCREVPVENQQPPIAHAVVVEEIIDLDNQ